jgi:hypothetical protein
MQRDLCSCCSAAVFLVTSSGVMYTRSYSPAQALRLTCDHTAHSAARHMAQTRDKLLSSCCL